MDKDAHDVYRLLVAIPTKRLAGGLQYLQGDDLASACTEQGIAYLRTLFADGPSAVGAHMAGRAEEGIGNSGFVATSAADLARRLLLAVADETAVSRPAALDPLAEVSEEADLYRSTSTPLVPEEG